VREKLKIVLLAYKDNPVGSVFMSAFIKRGIPVYGIITEQRAGDSAWKRFKNKVLKDGFYGALNRVAQVYLLKIKRRRIVDLAKEQNVPVYFVDKFNSTDCELLLDQLSPDLIVIASAPILKEKIFSKASIGCINAHPGWLPAYRGIGANAYALYNGDMPGITIHFVDSGIDTGNIINRERISIKKGDTVAKINDRAVARGAELVCDVILKIIAGQRIDFIKTNEQTGPVYRAMPYKLARKVNKKLKRTGEIEK